MSIAPLNVSAQTGLIPQTMLGYSDDGNSAIQILPTEITIGGTLTTNPIYVNISGTTGLTTSRPQGLNCNCDFDMNSNSVQNVSSVTRFDGGDLNLQTNNGGNIVLSNIGTGGSINLNALDNLNLSGNTLISLNAPNLNSFGTFDMNGNTMINLPRINSGYYPTYKPLVFDFGNGGGFDITGTNGFAGISSNNNGLITIYSSKGGNGGVLIENNYNSGMQFTEGINISDGYNNSIVSNNTTGLTLTTNTSITLNTQSIISQGNLTFSNAFNPRSAIKLILIGARPKAKAESVYPR